jgi:hypothetical protein
LRYREHRVSVSLLELEDVGICNFSSLSRKDTNIRIDCRSAANSLLDQNSDLFGSEIICLFLDSEQHLFEKLQKKL